MKGKTNYNKIQYTATCGCGGLRSGVGKLDRNHVKYSRNAGENHIKLKTKVMSITTIPEAKKTGENYRNV